MFFNLSCECHQSGNRWIFTSSRKDLLCPTCKKGHLHYHSRCERHLRFLDHQAVTCVLRVLQCENCGRTHREIPNCMIPFKRYSMESILQFYCTPKAVISEPVIIKRIKDWVTWFLAVCSTILRVQVAVDSSEIQRPDFSIRCQVVQTYAEYCFISISMMILLGDQSKKPAYSKQQNERYNT